MKKVLYYLIIMLAFTLNACDNEMDNMQGGDKEILTSSSEIVIKDGKITYPDELMDFIIQALEKRAPFYRQAQYIFDADELEDRRQIETSVQRLQELLKI